MQAKFKAIDISYITDSNDNMIVQIKADKDSRTNLQRSIKEYSNGPKNGDNRLEIEVRKYRNKRSLNANSYLWVLCQKLAEVLNIPADEVYRKNIKEGTVFKDVDISDDAVDTFIHSWKLHGIGWVAEKVDKGQYEGYSRIRLYFGSSSYNARQMSQLIERVIQECKQQSIEIMSPAELESLMNKWEPKV